jgi:hypothetical protein
MFDAEHIGDLQRIVHEMARLVEIITRYSLRRNLSTDRALSE